MPDYILKDLSTGFVESFIAWDGTVEEWDTGSGYTIELFTTSSVLELPPVLTGSLNALFSPNSFISTEYITEMQYSGSFTGSFDATGSFTGSLTGSFNGWSGSLDWIGNFPTASYRTGSFTGSFTGSLQGTSSYTETASYISSIKSGRITIAEWGLTMIGGNYTSSVSFNSNYDNTSYSVSLTCGADMRTLSVTNKQTSGFTVNSNSTSVMTDDVYWVTIPYNNP